MAAVTDQTALTFVDQHLRPLCDKTRALVAQIEAMERAWFNGVNGTLSGSADTVENRTATEGIPALAGTECANIVNALIAVADAISETAGRSALVEKATVRPLEV